MKNEYRVLTPESVEFTYELGGLVSRMLATALDHLIIMGAMLLIWLAFSLLALVGAAVTLGIFLMLAGGPLVAVALLATFLLYFGYFAYFEWKWNGQTPGKRVFDLRVIDDRGMNVDLFQSLVRNLFRVVDMMPFLFATDYVSVGFYGLGGAAAVLNPRQKRLGDWAAGTLVVRTRRPPMPDAILAPNERYNTLQEDGVTRARIRARLSLEERETLLQLCLRRGELEVDTRHTLFSDAASYLEERLEIARDPFLSEEKFVQNVAAVALADQELTSDRVSRVMAAAGRR